MNERTGMRPDPDNEGHVLCWAVVRDEPWHLGGVYATEGEAIVNQGVLGPEYRVAFGSHKTGTDDFVGQE